MDKLRPLGCRQRCLAGAAWLGLLSGMGAAAALPARKAVPEAAADSKVVAGGPSAGRGDGTGPSPSLSREQERGRSAAGLPRVSARRPPALPAAAALVPLIRQETAYSCGPAALASVLRYFHVWGGREQQLYPLLGTSPEEGTLPEKLAEGARSFGLVATVAQRLTIPALRHALGAGKLVILELQAWPTPGTPPVPWESRWDDGHYVVLFAMDDLYAYFMDPSTGASYTYLALDELGPRWHDINEARSVPLSPHDYQLGVLIGKPATPLRTVPSSWSAAPLQPLRKLE